MQAINSIQILWTSSENTEKLTRLYVEDKHGLEITFKNTTLLICNNFVTTRIYNSNKMKAQYEKNILKFKNLVN